MNEEATKQENMDNSCGSVLLSNEIINLCRNVPPLIDPFYPEKEKGLLKPASYHLRIGDKIRIEGQDYELSTEKNVQHIPAHGMAIIKTFERINMPNNLIGRWNLKVKKVYEGLLWVGGPQVDPGYSGFLFCPVYNLSETPYKIVFGDPLFTIDFVKTTPFDPDNPDCISLDMDRPTDSLSAIDTNRLKSATRQDFTKQWENIDKIKQESDKVFQDIRRFQSIIWAALTIIITAIAVLATIGATDVTWDRDWIPALLSFFALALATVALCVAIFKNRKKDKS